MAKIIFILISSLFIFGCNRSGKLNTNEIENVDGFDNEMKTLKFSNKGELFKIVESGRLQRNLMSESLGLQKAEYVKKKEELLMFIQKAPKLPIGYILEGGPVTLTDKQIEKFKKLYLQNLNRNAAKPLMGNIGCGFNADFCLSFYHEKDRVDYIFCLSCDQYKVFINGIYQKNISSFMYVEEDLKDLINVISPKN